MSGDIIEKTKGWRDVFNKQLEESGFYDSQEFAKNAAGVSKRVEEFKMKELLVKEYLHLNRLRRNVRKRLERDQAKLIETEKRIKEIEMIMRGETKHDTKNTVPKN